MAPLAAGSDEPASCAVVDGSTTTEAAAGVKWTSVSDSCGPWLPAAYAVANSSASPVTASAGTCQPRPYGATVSRTDR